MTVDRQDTYVIASPQLVLALRNAKYRGILPDFALVREIERILKNEHGRWVSFSYDRRQRLGYRFDSFWVYTARQMKSLSLLLAALGLAAFSRPSPPSGFGGASAPETPFLESELVFPLEYWHNHASMIVEAPNGDLLVDWFHGS